MVHVSKGHLSVIAGTYAFACKYLYIYKGVLMGKHKSFYLRVHSVVIHFFFFIEDLLCANTMSRL